VLIRYNVLVMQTNRQLTRVQYYAPNPQRRTRRPVAVAKKRPHIPIKVIVIAVLLVAVAGFGIHRAGAFSSSFNNKDSSTAQAAAAPEPVKPTITQAQMAEKMNQIIAANPDLDISISVGDPKDGNITHYGVNAVYEAASVAKVLTGVLYLHEVEKGTQSLNETISGKSATEQLTLMIEQSDNTAWKALNDALTHELLLKYAGSIGFTNYNPDINTMTSDDIARLLNQLQQGKLLNYEHTQIILGHMKNASRTEYLAPALPPGVSLYHKAGWLEDRVHDAAIIDNGRRPYILVIFTNGHAKYHATPREQILQQIAKVTLGRFISNEYLPASN
jgi:beta-lactamase class A